MTTKIALITGITGQDGSYLTELLLAKGYVVHGIKRRASSLNTQRIDHLYQDPHEHQPQLVLHYGDMTDGAALTQLLQRIAPDEIYHLAAQSHVAVSFDAPEYTADVDALGTMRLLEAIRHAGIIDKVRVFNAATSELFGLVDSPTQNEQSRFYPRSPYAAAKLYAYWMMVNYREAYGLFSCNGIMFNHESPRRGETFVTRKITRALCAIACGQQPCLFLGNLNAKRDWGHARDYMEMAWVMLQQPQPDDYVLATGTQHSVRDFVVACARCLDIEVEFRGEGEHEVGVIHHVDNTRWPQLAPGQVIVRVDPRYYRPAEVEQLCGDARKAQQQLGFVVKTSFSQLCQEMMEADLRLAKRQALLELHGYV